MIDKALEFLKNELDAYMKVWLGESADTVKLTQIVDSKGNSALKSRIGMTLINVVEERINKAQSRRATTVGDVTYFMPPEIKLNLLVLFVAQVSANRPYEEALKALSGIATFFQSHPSFEADTHPALDAKIEALIVEMQTLDLEGQNNIWGAIGSELLPSLLYKIRLVTILEDKPDETGKPITETQAVGLN